MHTQVFCRVCSSWAHPSKGHRLTEYTGVLSHLLFMGSHLIRHRLTKISVYTQVPCSLHTLELHQKLPTTNPCTSQARYSMRLTSHLAARLAIGAVCAEQGKCHLFCQPRWHTHRFDALQLHCGQRCPGISGLRRYWDSDASACASCIYTSWQ